MWKNNARYIAAIVAMAVIVGGATIAPAEDTQKIVSYEMQTDSQSVQCDFSGLLKMHRGIDSKLTDLKETQLKENQKILGDLKSKWIALVDEFTKEDFWPERTLWLQDEILSLNSRLAEKRLDQLMAVGKMSSEPAIR